MEHLTLLSAPPAVEGRWRQCTPRHQTFEERCRDMREITMDNLLISKKDKGTVRLVHYDVINLLNGCFCGFFYKIQNIILTKQVKWRQDDGKIRLAATFCLSARLMMGLSVNKLKKCLFF